MFARSQLSFSASSIQTQLSQLKSSPDENGSTYIIIFIFIFCELLSSLKR